MRYLVAGLILFSANVLAAPPEVRSCEDQGVTLNSVVSMRQFDGGAIKVFETDMIEPAAASVGLAIAIDRGDELSTMESFCRYVAGFSSVDLQGAIDSVDKNNVLTLTMGSTQTDENGVSQPRSLTVTIDKAAAAEEDLVKAEAK